MLPPYIIEQLRQREEVRRREQADRRVHIELPVPTRRRASEPPSAPEGEERGVVIIQVG